MPATDLKLINVFVTPSLLAILMLIAASISCALTGWQTLLHALTLTILG